MGASIYYPCRKRLQWQVQQNKKKNKKKKKKKKKKKMYCRNHNLHHIHEQMMKIWKQEEILRFSQHAKWHKIPKFQHFYFPFFLYGLLYL